jgi:DNA-binding beta-propeller fold protein YncE
MRCRIASFAVPYATPFALVAIAFTSSFCMAQTQYKVTDHWKIDGATRWDYLTDDAAAHLLYVTHGDRVEVIDTSTGKVRGAVTGLKGTHGVALPPGGKVGFVTDGGANAVVVFDRKDFHTVASVPAGTGPDGITYDTATKTVWAFNGRSHNATVIDAVTQKAVATVELPGRPEFPVSDGHGTVYANIEDKSLIVRIDARSYAVTASWPLGKCEGPSGLAIDAKGHRLFSVCDGVMAVVNDQTGAVVATPTIGDGPDAARYDAKRKLVFSSNGEGTLTILKQDSPDKYSLLQTLPTQRSARTLALDQKTGKVYLAAAEFGPAPAPTAESPHPRPAGIPGTFTILVVSPE